MVTRDQRQDFLRGYIECALWTDVPVAPAPQMREVPLSTLTALARPALWFLRRFEPSLTASSKLQRARVHGIQPPTWAELGHMLWLTRNGHGSGFWSEGVALGTHLSNMARVMGEAHLLPDGDGDIALWDESKEDAWTGT